MNKDSSGFSRIVVIIIIAIVLVLGLGGYFLLRGSKPADDKKESMDTTQTTAEEKPDTTDKTAANETDTGTYLTISDWGVKVPLDSSVAGLSYTLTKTGGSFRTTALTTAGGTSCETNSVEIARGTKTDKVPAEVGDGPTFYGYFELSLKTAGMVAVHIGDNYYVTPGYRGASCATNGDQAKLSAETEAQAAIQAALNKMKAE